MHVVGIESRLVALCVSGPSNRFLHPHGAAGPGGRGTTFRGSSTEPTLAQIFGPPGHAIEQFSGGVGAPAQTLHKQHRFSPVIQDEVQIHVSMRADG